MQFLRGEQSKKKVCLSHSVMSKLQVIAEGVEVLLPACVSPCDVMAC